MERVSIVACPSYEEAQVRDSLLQVLAPIDGLSFVKPGMKIAIKTNLVCGAAPEKATVTHPVMLGELTRLLVARGAKVVVGDSPSGPFTQAGLQKVYKASCLEPVLAAGGVLNENLETVEVGFPEAKVLKRFTYTDWLREADAIICFSKLKTHGMMGLSANVKNMFGSIPGTMKPEYHYRFPDHDQFANMIVDINEYLKPCLYLTDGVMAMEGNGPTAGTPRFVGALLASKKPYALDMVCAHLIGQDAMTVPTIKASVERGLCPASLEEISVCGDLESFVVPDFVRIEHHRSITFAERFPSFLLPVVTKTMASRPQVKASECIGCRRCADICPAKAIQMVAKKPEIDRTLCIRCFCCQEFCPKGAMKVHRTLLARLLQH